MPAEPTRSSRDSNTRLRLVWGAPEVTSGRWRLGVLCVRPKSLVPRRPLCLILSIRGMLWWGFVLALLTHIGGTAFIYSEYRKRPQNLITYADLALPWRWTTLNGLRGQALLAQGKADFRAMKIGEAFGALRVGLDRYPHDTEARLQLATLYVIYFRRDRAGTALNEGLEFGPVDVAYLQGAIGFLKDADQPEKLLKFVQRARTLVDAERVDTKGGTDEKRVSETKGVNGADERVVSKKKLLDATAADALVALKRYPEAVAVVEATEPRDVELVGRIHVAVALGAGDSAAAESAVERWLASSPNSEVALATAVGVYRQAGRFEEMDAALVQLKNLDPTSPSFASMGVVQNILAGRDAVARAALEDCVFRFGSDAKTLDLLARDIGVTGNIALLDRLEEVMRDHGFDTQIVLFSRVLAQLDNGDWRSAQSTHRQLAAKEATLALDVKAFMKTADSLIMICAEGTQGPKLVLLDSISRYRGRLKLYTQSIDWLIAARQWEVAREVAGLAERAFPQSVQLAQLRSRIEPEMQRIAAEEAVRSSTRTVHVVDTLPDAASLYALLEKETKAGAPDAALSMIQAVRRKEPSWLPAARDEIDRRELDLALSTDDLLQLQAVVRAFLRSDKAARFEIACSLARKSHDAGEQPAALLLVNEVLRRQPKHTEAIQLSNAWNPKKTKEGT